MDLLAEIKEKTSTAIILITHDLGVVASMADRVAVMYAGKVVETGTCEDIFYRNAHPYTQALLKSLPSVDMNKTQRLVSIPGTPPDLLNPPKGCGFGARCTHCMKICHEEQPPVFKVGEGHEAACWLLHPIARAQQKGVSRMSSNEKLIVLDDVCKHFKVSGGMLKAVDHISLDIYKGETLGLVGESGCGKSTLGRVAMGIYPATSGKLYYAGEELNLKNAATRFKYAKKAQIIFQDPYASLDPRMTVSSIIEEGMVIHGMYDAKRRQERVYELLELVG